MIVDVMKFRRTPSEGRTLDENNLRAEPTITTTVLASGLTTLAVPVKVRTCITQFTCLQ